MKCPHCAYEHTYAEWDKSEGEYKRDVIGNYGGFWTHPVRMTADDHPDIWMYACPSCMKTFVE